MDTSGTTSACTALGISSLEDTIVVDRYMKIVFKMNALSGTYDSALQSALGNLK